MKIMAIDYGDAHTGVAISDRTLTLTGFSTVITAYRPEAVIEKLLPLISEHEVSELVLGHPLNMDGTRGPRAEKAEGFAEIARKFRMVADIEKSHEERYLKLLENVEMQKVFEKSEEVMWVCRNCGHLHFGKEAPQICPVCEHLQSFFQVKEENY